MAWVSLDVFRCLVISGDGRRGWYLVGVSKIEGCSELSMFLLRVSADQLFLFLGRSQKRAASILGARISREQQDAKNVTLRCFNPSKSIFLEMGEKR